MVHITPCCETEFRKAAHRRSKFEVMMQETTAND